MKIRQLCRQQKRNSGKKFQTVPIESPLRAQHVFECLGKFICPDCGSATGEIFEIDGAPLANDEIGCACPVCGWEMVVGGVPEEVKED